MAISDSKGLGEQHTNNVFCMGSPSQIIHWSFVFLLGDLDTTVGGQKALWLGSAFLERDCNMLEVNQFRDQVFWFISSGFKNNPPKEGLSIHRQSLINSTWLLALIKQEAALRMSKHQRIMALLKTKKTGTFWCYWRRWCQWQQKKWKSTYFLSIQMQRCEKIQRGFLLCLPQL